MALPGRNEKTLPNNWLLFFHIGQRAFGVEGVPGRAGFPMCRMKGLGHLHEGLNTSGMKGANAAVLGESGTLKLPEGIMFSSTASRLKFILSDASCTRLFIVCNPSRPQG